MRWGWEVSVALFKRPKLKISLCLFLTFAFALLSSFDWWVKIRVFLKKENFLFLSNEVINTTWAIANEVMILRLAFGLVCTAQYMEMFQILLEILSFFINAKISRKIRQKFLEEKKWLKLFRICSSRLIPYVRCACFSSSYLLVKERMKLKMTSIAYFYDREN